MQSNNKLSETLITLLGIWLIVSPLPDFFANIFAISSYDYGESGNQMRWLSIIHLATKVFCGFALIFSRAKIVSYLGLNIDSPSDSRNLLSAGIFLLGVYFFLNGFVALGQHIGTVQSPNTSNPYLLWQALFSIGSGIIVALVSSRLGKFWWVIKRT
ncbi:hypothetical protein FE810_15550 [Thalassotalea litorea]|uniref:Uncharacterized protein n=1 Tax=Thalassotalea litorea TaxID=2020715 RepID=A0A5R9IBV1_9GAMM|nr:hypothetical protein [Thalassotalea litorea]TLU61086.1 hypothetical protein FE810_15550 [Thalassotalea litorea]